MPCTRSVCLLCVAEAFRPVVPSGFHNVRAGHVHLACSFARACRVAAPRALWPALRKFYGSMRIVAGYSAPGVIF